MARAIAVSFLVLLLAFPTVFGADHEVGDTGGWALGVITTPGPLGKLSELVTIWVSLFMFLAFQKLVKLFLKKKILAYTRTQVANSI